MVIRRHFFTGAAALVGAGAVNATIEALKEFWSLHTDLEEALGGAVAHTAPPTPAAPAPAQHKEHAQ